MTYRSKLDRARVLTSGVGALVLALAVPAATSAQQQPSTPTSLVFDSVTVVDVEHGKLLPAQRVVITGNRIAALGAVGTVSLPPGAQLVAAQGKYLIPGLWDMHSHGMDSNDDRSPSPFYRESYIFYGITGVRYWPEGIEAGEGKIPAWTVSRLSEILAGTKVGPVRQIPGWDPARHRGEGHISDTMTALRASDRGAPIVDHIGQNLSGLLDSLCIRNAQPRYQTATVASCRRAAEHLRRNNTWWVVTLMEGLYTRRLELSARAYWIYMGAQRRCRRHVYDELPRDSPLLEVRNWLRDFAFFDGYVYGKIGAPRSSVYVEPYNPWSGAYAEAYNPRWSTAPGPAGILSIAYQAGMPILVGPESSPLDVHTELALLVAEGLPPLAALQAATLNPARWLRATDSLGTVAQGKLADLVLLDANPLEDITNTTTIRAVVANGRYFDHEALNRLLPAKQLGGC